MKRTIELNIGGKLETGDVVGIAYNNCIVFGWFVEPGQYGSLKFIPFSSTKYMLERLDEFQLGTLDNNYYKKIFTKGLEYKDFRRDYIITFGKVDNRAFKIANPGEFFYGSNEMPNYLRGKRELNNLKFPAK